MLPLQCPAQNYAWGRPASCSEVAQLAQANGQAVHEEKPYAELWVGTHPSGPAVVTSTAGTLKAWIEQNPASLGDKTFNRWGAELPFLFKVLSVQTALSIQSHPDKKLAEQLHASDPKNYKDDNHKPEMALALNDFRALCAFVSSAELKEALQTVPELAAVLGEGPVGSVLGAPDGDKQALQSAFTAVMTADSGLVAAQLEALVARLGAQQAAGEVALSVKEALVLELYQQYPADVGVLAAFFLNLVSLQPGQAIYLAANNPHAYVSGELVECMATSDNVIRAGLTPKFRDTAVLCSSLTYEQGLPEVLEGIPQNEFIRCYRPPFEEFEVWAVKLPAGATTQMPVNEGPMLMLVQGGRGTAAAKPVVSCPDLATSSSVARGSISFVAAGTELSFSAEEGELTVWLTACNGNFFRLQDVLESAVAPAVADGAAALPELVAA